MGKEIEETVFSNEDNITISKSATVTQTINEENPNASHTVPVHDQIETHESAVSPQNLMTNPCEKILSVIKTA